MAISIFYAVGTLIGGAGAPALFGTLIESRSRTPLTMVYLAAAALMIVTAIVEWFLGIAAEGKSLESISPALSVKF